MALTADDVVEKRFKRALQGYDRAEVDDFLDAVADRLSELDAQVVELRDELAGGGAAGAPAAAAVASGQVADSDLLSRTLLAAQRTADETVAEARSEADRLVAEAQREADSTHQRTVAQAEALREEVRRQVDERREDLRLTLERVQRAVAELRRTRAEYVGRVRDVLAEQLTALERAGEIPDLPDRLTDLASLDRDPQVAQLLEAEPGPVAGAESLPEPAPPAPPTSPTPPPAQTDDQPRDPANATAVMPAVEVDPGDTAVDPATDDQATGEFPQADETPPSWIRSDAGR